VTGDGEAMQVDAQSLPAAIISKIEAVQEKYVHVTTPTPFSIDLAQIIEHPTKACCARRLGDAGTNTSL
jgi:hypothetical protein